MKLSHQAALDRPGPADIPLVGVSFHYYIEISDFHEEVGLPVPIAENPVK